MGQRLRTVCAALVLATGPAFAADLDDPGVAALPPPPAAGRPPIVCTDYDYCWHPYAFRADPQGYNDPRPVPSTYDFWQPPPPALPPPY